MGFFTLLASAAAVLFLHRSLPWWPVNTHRLMEVIHHLLHHPLSQVCSSCGIVCAYWCKNEDALKKLLLLLLLLSWGDDNNGDEKNDGSSNDAVAMDNAVAGVCFCLQRIVVGVIWFWWTHACSCKHKNLKPVSGDKASCIWHWYGPHTDKDLCRGRKPQNKWE